MGVIKIYRLEIQSNYSKPVVYQAEDLYPILIPGTDGLTVQKEDDCLRILSETDDPYLVATRPLYKNNLILVYGLPFLAALIVLGRLLRDTPRSKSVRQKPAANSLSSANPINSLNGLRGIAIMMVVGEHTVGRLAGFGTGGVWIFMALSGFLLAKPYIQSSEVALSWSYANTFFWRRLQRIFPIYSFYIFVAYLLNLRLDEAIRHLVFLQGNGHLWFIPQLMLFYLVFPVIMAVNHLVFRGRPRVILIFLLIALVTANLYLTRDVFSLYGMNYIHYRFFIGTFLSGVFFSYLYYGIYEPAVFSEKWQARIETLCSLLAVIILFFFLFRFSAQLWGGRRSSQEIILPGLGLLPGC